MTIEEENFVVELARWDTGGVCDVFSVLEWFRPVWLLAIENYKYLWDDFFEDNWYKREDWPSNEVRIKEFKKILQKYYPDYRICDAWAEDFYFLYHKDAQKELDRFLAREDVWSLEWEIELGSLFGYPICCVKKHCSIESDLRISKEKHKMMKENLRRIIPFGRCSLECGKDWIQEYARIVEKYNLDMDGKCFAEDFVIYD